MSIYVIAIGKDVVLLAMCNKHSTFRLRFISLPTILPSGIICYSYFLLLALLFLFYPCFDFFHLVKFSQSVLMSD